MSFNRIESELLVELSKQEQQLLSGGVKGLLETKGDFVYGRKKFPATITVKVRNLPEINQNSPADEPN
jgi:hypothetical protein